MVIILGCDFESTENEDENLKSNSADQNVQCPENSELSQQFSEYAKQDIVFLTDEEREPQPFSRQPLWVTEDIKLYDMVSLIENTGIIYFISTINSLEVDVFIEFGVRNIFCTVQRILLPNRSLYRRKFKSKCRLK